MDLRKAKETSNKFDQEAQDREEKLQRDEEELENLKKSIAKSKKNKADKVEKLDVLKKNIRKLNDDDRSASKRMMLLSYEYFDVAKKIEDENGLRVFFNQVVDINYKFKRNFVLIAGMIMETKFITT